MKNFIRFLGSMKLTLVLMLLVAIWFALGACLGVSSQYGNTFRLLNDQLVGDALFGLPHLPPRIWSALFHLGKIQHDMVSGLPAPNTTVVSWLWVAFILAFFLGLNLIFATKDWFFDIFKKRIDFRKFLLLAMHFLFGIVLIGHLISAVSGFKGAGEVPLWEGQETEFLEDYVLRVDEISVEPEHRADPSSKTTKRLWTPDRFIHQDLSVAFSLLFDGERVFKGKVREFAPVYYKGFQFVLCPFSFRSQVSHDFLSTGLGGKIVISRNPGVVIMMVFQPLWILVLLFYTITVLRQNIRGKGRVQ